MLFNEIAYGPIRSRRLGVSLGMEIMPLTHKLCTFDCIYCECGWNQPISHPVLPTREEVRKALEDKLALMQKEDADLDVITFSGNGEPTLHPHFLGIIEDTCMLRNQYYPNAKVSVLSNSTFIHKPEVFDALNKVDNNILKLDTIDATYINKVDRPTGHYDVKQVIEHMKAFKGNLIVQTLFMKGTFEGESVDNTIDDYILPWLEVVKQIAPRQVMIYTIDRETPAPDLLKATHEELDRIGELVREAGIPCSVSY